MVRTYGAVDIRKRKSRSDKGKKRKLYAGRKVKGAVRRKFERKIGNKEVIKIWVWEKGAMSKSGYRLWNRHVRPYIKPVVYYPGIRADVHVSHLQTKEDIEELMLEIVGYEGEFLIMGFSRTWRNSYHVKPVKLCRVIIRESREGLHAKIINNYRLWRYWFWRDK